MNRSRGARCSSSTPTRMPPPEIHVPVAPAEQELLEAWLVAEGRPQGAHHGAAARRQEGDDRAGAPQRGAGLPHAFRHERDGELRRARVAAGGAAAAEAAAAHRVLRHLDDPGQRDGGVDGGMRRRADEEGRIPEVQDQEFRVEEADKPRAVRPIELASDFWTISRRWSRSCVAVMRACWRTAVRSRTRS